MAASVVSTVADSPVVKAAGRPGGQLVGGDWKFGKSISDIYLLYIYGMHRRLHLYMHVNVHAAIICAHCIMIC